MAGTTQRRAEISRLLTARGYLSASDTAAHFGVSDMTVRRDFAALQSGGLARRVPGGLGAVSAEPLGVSFEQRSAADAVLKRRLAEWTVEHHLKGAGVVGLDAGTTVAPIAGLVAAGTTVVSHSVAVISTCVLRADVHLIGLGGDYQPATRSFGGALTRAALADLNLDVAVLSATALTTTGTWSTNSVDADTKRLLAHAADRVVLVVDQTKFAARAPLRALRLDQIDALVTGPELPEDARAWLTGQVAQVDVVNES